MTARIFGKILLAGLAALAVAGPATAGSFEQGHTAYMRGDYAESLSKLRPLAELGHAPAAYIIGRHYQLGQGVERDLGEAWYWYRRAEARGHHEAGLFRHLLRTKWNISEVDLKRGKAKYAALASRNAPTSRSTAEPSNDKPDETDRAASRNTAAMRRSGPPDATSKTRSEARAALRVATRRLSPRLKSAFPRVALRPRSRPATPDSVLASRTRSLKTVRVTNLGPTSAPTRAAAPAPELAVRTARRRADEERPAETAVRRNRDGYHPDDDEDEYDVAVDPGAIQDDAPVYAPGAERPVWIAPPPGAIIAPGYWRYRAWQMRRWQARRAWRGPGWRRGWHRRGWRRY